MTRFNCDFCKDLGEIGNAGPNTFNSLLSLATESQGVFMQGDKFTPCPHCKPAPPAAESGKEIAKDLLNEFGPFGVNIQTPI
jgi:hypothetical protein